MDGESNAAVSGLGVRGRMLVLGVPLWSVLSPQQRIALLGHELGHFVNGDTRHGLLVGSAYRSLVLWYGYLTPAFSGSDNWLHMLTNLALVPFASSSAASSICSPYAPPSAASILPTPPQGASVPPRPLSGSWTACSSPSRSRSI